MPSVLRLLHFADLHIGMENYGRIDPQTGMSTRVRDFLDRLDEVIAYALDHQADLVIFAGDAFKTRDPDVTQQREFARRIKRLADAVPVFILVGNHDLPGMAARATSVDIFHTLEVSNVIVGRTIASRVVQTKSGPIFLGWVPFPARGRLLAQEQRRGASVAELDRAVEELVIAELAELAAIAAAHDMPRVLVGHFSAAGAVFGSEQRSALLSREVTVPRSALAEPAWDYVALGHLHKHQCITPAENRPPVVYAGSLERIDFGEEQESKGFCWVELTRGAAKWQFVPVNARPFCTIAVDARGQADPTAVALAAIEKFDVAGAVVRVQVRVSEAHQAALRRREIENALSSAAFVAAVIPQVERETRLAGGGIENPQALTPPEWLERYFQAKNKPAARIAQLQAAAAALWAESER